MKKYYFLIVIMVLASSCSIDYLSCDAGINRWAMQNTEYYSSASRTELVNLPLKRLRAVYRGFSNEKKASLWHDKVHQYSQYLSGIEKEAYLELDSIIDAVYLKNTDKEITEEMINLWEEKMRNIFLWNDNDIFYSSCTWLSYEEYVIASILQYEETQTRLDHNQNEIQDCECRHNNGCPGSMSCEKLPKGCNEVQDCGIVHNSICNGTCW